MILPDMEGVRAQKVHLRGSFGPLVRSYNGVLHRPLDGQKDILIYQNHYLRVDIDATYEIWSPMHIAFKEERRHHQISDLAYEQKSRNALIDYLTKKYAVIKELSREVMKDGQILAEWEAVFEVGVGRTIFWE